ncbi:MAG: type II secretion system F family protein, partial [Chloroflexota bacterium]
LELTTIIAISATVIALIVIVVGVISIRSERDLLEERLNSEPENESLLNFELSEEEEQQLSARSRMLESLDEVLSERSWGKNQRTLLSRADLKITVAEFAILHVITMGAVFAATYFVFFRGNLIFAILGGFIGFFLPRIYVARQVSTRLIRFENQLPDTLGLWVNALRSGYSVLQSMEAISKDSPEPTATEFSRVVREVQLGINVEDALDHLLERVDSEDLDLVITAVNIQREVGGNLAEILEVIANTIRERVKLKGEIRVLTTQGRTTGYIISALPILLALLLNTINPGFIGPLFENRACGWPMVGAGLALIGMGTAAIQKIVDIEI